MTTTDLPRPSDGASFWSAESARGVRVRVVVEAVFTLTRPAHIGSGEGSAVADAAVLTDPVDGGPLMPGEGLAGALRRYLRVRGGGYPWQFGWEERRGRLAHERLLGDDRDRAGDDDALPSPLVVEDALGRLPEGVRAPEVRSSTAIDSEVRARKDGSLRDREAWPAGTTFCLGFELVVTEREDEGDLRRALATAMWGLHTGEVRVGAKTRRGYGAGRLSGVRVRRYGLAESPEAGPDPLLAWLRQDGDLAETETEADSAEAVCAWLLDADSEEPEAWDLVPDRRVRVVMDTTARPVGPLLFGGGEAGAADESFFEARHGEDGQVVPVARGTGLAGPLRARALRVAHAVREGDPSAAERWRDRVFGFADGGGNEGEAAQASRVLVDEAAIEHGRADLVQSRLRIDPFLGGASDGALFHERAVTPRDETLLPLRVELEGPEDRDVGLLLHVLRDVWTQDLAFGKGEGIGRGRIEGRDAALTFYAPDVGEPRVYRLEARVGSAYPDSFGLSVQGPAADRYGLDLDAYDRAMRGEPTTPDTP